MKHKLFDHLKTFGQEHLLTFRDVLDDSEREALSVQIEGIDFAQIAELYERRNEPAELLTHINRACDPPAYCFESR